MQNNKHRRRKKRNSRVIIASLLIILLSIITYSLFGLRDLFVNYNIENNLRNSTSVTSVKSSDINKKAYDYVVKEAKDVGIGNLILVNNSIPYSFPEDSDIVSVLSSKNKSYKISEDNTLLDSEVLLQFNRMMGDFEKSTNIHDIIINSAYRTSEDQKRILNEKLKTLGASEAYKWAAKPGYSEHHTGYALDIGIYKDNGISQAYRGSGKYRWIDENCGDYGFILRYAENKTEITGISYEPWHYRYVGKPHANIIKNKGFCFEEYIDFLRSYSFESDHLEFVDSDNTLYEIYYVKASGDKTKIPVPKKSKYSISGNNVDGFIVTVKK